MKVAKGGNGSGRVTASGLDCGGACSASFSYGTLAQFTAAADSGSIFDGWGGVCAADRDSRCTLPIGPITLLRPRFAREAPPSAPGAITVTAATRTSITLSWGAATDDTGVRSYELFVGDESSPRLTTAGTSATLQGLECGQHYDVSVVALDTGGNRSARTRLQAATAECALPTLRVIAVRGTVARGRLTVRFVSSVRVNGTVALVVRSKVAKRKQIVVRPGANSVAFALPRPRPRRVGVVLRLADPQGGKRTFTWSFRVQR